MSHPEVVPFLMFTGRAEEAMSFYAATIPGSRILEVKRGPDGNLQRATMQIGTQTVICIDSPPVHAFTFTP